MKIQESQNIEELREKYKSIRAPRWLLQITIEKAARQQNEKRSNWLVPSMIGLASLALLVMLIPNKEPLHSSSTISPSLADMQVYKVKPINFRMPSMNNLSGIPSIPKTPQKINQESNQIKQTS